ncbi:MAG: hypothetical protein PHX08_06840 [Lachnospiraceae bacterium]|nr:hypothetical protein [Lachnospiraceae bacterium]
MKNKGIINLILGGLIGGTATYAGCHLFMKKEKDESEKVNKFKTYYNMLNQWLELKNNGKKLEQFFIQNGYTQIAVYGMGAMGERLLEELRGTSVKVVYGIDKNVDNQFDEIPVYSVEDELNTNVDAIIVTAVFAFDSIEEELDEIYECPIISLEDVIVSI